MEKFSLAYKNNHFWSTKCSSFIKRWWNFTPKASFFLIQKPMEKAICEKLFL